VAIVASQVMDGAKWAKCHFIWENGSRKFIEVDSQPKSKQSSKAVDASPSCDISSDPGPPLSSPETNGCDFATTLERTNFDD
ncbi:hypothetical protein THAOC_09790, partial [Thalassiosira oceanica]